jgi:hypothetical protein
LLSPPVKLGPRVTGYRVGTLRQDLAKLRQAT